MNTNLFYFKDLNSIGGIETFFWNLARKYGKEYDITIMYQNGDAAQVARLAQYVRVRKYRPGETIRAKRVFVAFNAEILSNVEADEYYQMLHGDYRSLGVIPGRHEKIQKWIACSEVVKSAYQDITGEIPEVCYNPFIPEKPKKALRLISATRLTPDKGLNRMNTLAEVLEKAGVPFTWDVYTDVPRNFSNPDIICHKPRLDILPHIAAADYYVQLSDAEGYCYSLVESLTVGTPVITTDIRVLPEIGVVDGVNAIVLPLDMHEVPVDRILKGLKKFKYTAPADRWNEFLLPVPPNYEEEMKAPATVVCKRVFLDLERSKMVDPGEKWAVTLGRAEFLFDLGVVDIIEEGESDGPSAV